MVTVTVDSSGGTTTTDVVTALVVTVTAEVLVAEVGGDRRGTIGTVEVVGERGAIGAAEVVGERGEIGLAAKVVGVRGEIGMAKVVGGRVEIDTLEPRTRAMPTVSCGSSKLQWFCRWRWWCGGPSLYCRQWHCGDNIVSWQRQSLQQHFHFIGPYRILVPSQL